MTDLDRKRVPPPTPIPDPIVITVKRGDAVRVLEVSGKYFDSPVKSFPGWYVGSFHGMTVTLKETP